MSSMKKYRPIATYYTAEDIICLFPNSTLKGDEASIIWQRYNEGFGEPRKIGEVDEEAYYTEEDVKEDANFVLSGDGIHGVRFTRGSMEFLRKGIEHGFYIDLYKLDE